MACGQKGLGSCTFLPWLHHHFLLSPGPGHISNTIILPKGFPCWTVEYYTVQFCQYFVVDFECPQFLQNEPGSIDLPQPWSTVTKIRCFPPFSFTWNILLFICPWWLPKVAMVRIPFNFPDFKFIRFCTSPWFLSSSRWWFLFDFSPLCVFKCLLIMISSPLKVVAVSKSLMKAVNRHPTLREVRHLLKIEFMNQSKPRYFNDNFNDNL